MVCLNGLVQKGYLHRYCRSVLHEKKTQKASLQNRLCLEVISYYLWYLLCSHKLYLIISFANIGTFLETSKFSGDFLFVLLLYSSCSRFSTKITILNKTNKKNKPRCRDKQRSPISEKTQKYLTPSCLAHTAAFCQTVGIEFHAKILTNRRHPHRWCRS